MPRQTVKFYQVGSFAAGNRLLDPEQRTVQARAGRSNTLTSGHRACQGCGEALGARYARDAAMRATEGRLVAVNATGCLEVFSTPYPESSWQLPWLHSLFANAPSVASGVAAALKVKGREDIRVVAQGAAPVYDVVAGLGGRPITKRSLHSLLADVLEERIEPERLTFLDLDWRLVERELARTRERRRSGPHAENILRDVGVVAARLA